MPDSPQDVAPTRDDAPATPPLPGWRRAVVVLLLAWAAVAFGHAASEVGRQSLARTDPQAVAAWRLGEPRAASLRTFLHTMAVHLPPDRVVAFSAESDDSDQRFFLTLWSAYFLPRQRVVRLPGTAAEPDLAAVPADYVITYNHRIDFTKPGLPSLEEVARHPSGALYRVGGAR